MKRFSLESDYIQGICDMEEHPQGDYVKFEDAQKLVEAVNFYADLGSWSRTGHMITNSDVELMCSTMEEKYQFSCGGKTARQTLKELGLE